MFWGFKVDSQAKFKCPFLARLKCSQLMRIGHEIGSQHGCQDFFLSLFLLDLHPFGSMQGGNVFVQRLHSIKPDGTGIL